MVAAENKQARKLISSLGSLDKANIVRRKKRGSAIAARRGFKKLAREQENKANFLLHEAQGMAELDRLRSEINDLTGKLPACQSIPLVKAMCKIQKQGERIQANFEKGRRIRPPGYKPGRRLSADATDKLRRLAASRAERRRIAREGYL